MSVQRVQKRSQSQCIWHEKQSQLTNYNASYITGVTKWRPYWIVSALV